jgi:uncharacterized membrane protein (UPF0127 family)
MRYFSPILLLTGLMAIAGCGGPQPTTLEDFPTRPLTLPGGHAIKVETMYTNIDLLRGLMYRTSLAPDRGMLFVYPRPDHYQTLTYNVLIPLDIIWMDANRRIVAMDENAPPCKTQASKCPRYGGPQIVSFALEMAAGMARKYGLEVGQTMQW